nr:MAG TPA: hypothetical protein [Caudoviricetes sp.]
MLKPEILTAYVSLAVLANCFLASFAVLFIAFFNIVLLSFLIPDNAFSIVSICSLSTSKVSNCSSPPLN